MKSLTPLVIVLALASAFGVWYTRSRGEFRKKKTINGPKLDAGIIGVELGARVTMVQFSSAFCSPCRATKARLENMVQDMPDVRYAQIDAESHLELERQLDVRSTPIIEASSLGPLTVFFLRNSPLLRVYQIPNAMAKTSTTRSGVNDFT